VRPARSPGRGRPLPGPPRRGRGRPVHPPSGRTGVATERSWSGPTPSRSRSAALATRPGRSTTSMMRTSGGPAPHLRVFTPNGNWSGWPPHKHDIDDPPREAVLEETYYYQISRPEGWGIQRSTIATGRATWSCRAPRGPAERRPGLSPFASTQGYDAYYLNPWPATGGRWPTRRSRPGLGPDPVAVDGTPTHALPLVRRDAGRRRPAPAPARAGRTRRRHRRAGHRPSRQPRDVLANRGSAT
jgi:hypothetical protein